MRQALKEALDALKHVEDVYCVTYEEAMLAIEKALAQPYPEYDRGFSNGWDKCAARQITQPDNTPKLYEELRSIIDGGSESFTHADAVQYLKDNLAPLKWTPEDTAYRPGGLAQAEQEPVAWLITDESINSLQVASIQRVIDRLKYAHHTDLCLRINGQDERFEADWVKHLQRAATPPKRQPLTDAQIWQLVNDCSFNRDLHADKFARAIEAAHDIGDKT